MFTNLAIQGAPPCREYVGTVGGESQPSHVAGTKDSSASHRQPNERCFMVRLAGHVEKNKPDTENTGLDAEIYVYTCV